MKITSHKVHISERFQCGNHRRILASSFSPTGRERSPKSSPQHAPSDGILPFITNLQANKYLLFIKEITNIPQHCGNQKG
jgi:hypothetical protein